MLEVDVYNSKGQKEGKISLNPEVFGQKINWDLLHQATLAYAANKRLVQASTKTRGQVRGGGRKPWRQKGTGRARAGSSRSPIWQGGGVVFGPTSDQNYKKKIPQAIKNQAVTIALSAKVSKKRFLVLDKLSINQPKTKELTTVLTKLPIEGSALLILPAKDEKIIRAARNIPYLETLPVSNINAYNLLRFNYLIILSDAIKLLENKYSSSKDSSTKNVNEPERDKTDKSKANKNESK